MTPSIRPATLADVLDIQRLFQDMAVELDLSYPNYTTEYSRDAFTESLVRQLGFQDPTLLCFVAQSAAGIIGFTCTFLVTRTVGAPHRFGMGVWLHVSPAWRQQGIGHSLLRATLDLAQARGITQVEIAAAPSDFRWAKLGWIPYSISYMLPLSEAIQAMDRLRPTEVEEEPPTMLTGFA